MLIEWILTVFRFKGDDSNSGGRWDGKGEGLEETKDEMGELLVARVAHHQGQANSVDDAESRVGSVNLCGRDMG